MLTEWGLESNNFDQMGRLLAHAGHTSGPLTLSLPQRKFDCLDKIEAGHWSVATHSKILNPGREVTKYRLLI